MLKQHALADLNRALEPGDMFALSRRGEVFACLTYEIALKNFDRVLSILPNDAFSLSRRDRVYYRLKRDNNAFDEFNKALEFDPSARLH